KRIGEVFLGAVFGQDKVVTMDSRGDANPGNSGRHKLKKRHLRCRVLHSYTIRRKVYVRLAALKVLEALLTVQVRKQYLLGERKRSVYNFSCRSNALRQLLVNGLDHV